jgi:hypothetical protein
MQRFASDKHSVDKFGGAGRLIWRARAQQLILKLAERALKATKNNNC